MAARSLPPLPRLSHGVPLWTLVAPLVPGVWALAFCTVHGPQVLALFHHGSGMGVCAQTSVPSVLLVRWLAWPGAHHAAMVAGPAPMPLNAERYVLVSLVALSQVIRTPGESPAQTARPGPQ
jgi:hypothetical protein